ncbi:hypothetical protein TNCV_2268081 [Trichonephila clavipes]|nr:hypothetical protein TNCV_2268081 [Trichonephila clavipes]
MSLIEVVMVTNLVPVLLSSSPSATEDQPCRGFDSPLSCYGSKSFRGVLWKFGQGVASSGVVLFTWPWFELRRQKPTHLFLICITSN